MARLGAGLYWYAVGVEGVVRLAISGGYITNPCSRNVGSGVLYLGFRFLGPEYQVMVDFRYMIVGC